MKEMDSHGKIGSVSQEKGITLDYPIGAKLTADRGSLYGLFNKYNPNGDDIQIIRKYLVE